MASYDDRFVTVWKEGNLVTEKIVYVDRETGVNYLWVHSGYAGGLTPVLDADGKPVISRLT